MPSRDETARNIPRLLVLMATLAALAAAIVWTTFHRGPWYDEFYTQYVTRPSPGWFEALTTSWLADNHPPFFYILMRATTWLGPIEAHRLVNSAVAILALAGGWLAVRRQSALHSAAIVTLLLLTANPWTISAATELRSYFISLCTGSLLALLLTSIWIAPDPPRPARSAVYAVTVTVAFNIHIITTLFSGVLLLPFVAVALVRRDRHRLRALLPAPLVAGAVFLGVTTFQFSYWNRNTQVFWIPAGFDAARYSIEYAMQRTLEANPLILLGSAIGAGMLLRDALRAKSMPDKLEAALLIGIGITLALAVLAGIHLIRPILIEKYLVAAIGALAFLMAVCCARLLSAVPHRIEALLLAAALAVSVFSLVHNARWTAKLNSWLGTGRLIAQTVAHCPDTRVHTDDFWNSDVMAMQPADNRRVAPWAYRLIARRLGFTVAPSASRHLSVNCPNLFWAEHDTKHRFDTAQILAHIRDSGFAVPAIFIYRVGDGWVASDRPLGRKD